MLVSFYFSSLDLLGNGLSSTCLHHIGRKDCKSFLWWLGLHFIRDWESRKVSLKQSWCRKSIVGISGCIFARWVYIFLYNFLQTGSVYSDFSRFFVLSFAAVLFEHKISVRYRFIRMQNWSHGWISLNFRTCSTVFALDRIEFFLADNRFEDEHAFVFLRIRILFLFLTSSVACFIMRTSNVFVFGLFQGAMDSWNWQCFGLLF